VVLAQSQSRNVNGFRLSRERPHDDGDALLKLLGAEASRHNWRLAAVF